MVSSQLILNDCLVAMKEMADNSVDSIVTDPPYGLSFMNKKWDYDVPSVEIWKEALRVLKPGGHLLAFAGSRTYHRLAINVEDAGFEIRDQIMWIYGSGFPKSMNISKAIDKAAGVEQEVIGIGRSGAPETHQTSYNMSKGGSSEMGGEYEITKPATPEAEQWDGWGTALKPAHEPVVVARKPVENTIVENVLEHGTGAINIDGCRVGDIIQDTSKNGRSADKHKSTVYESGLKKDFEGKITTGRFPANVIMDKEASEILDEQTGELSAGHAPKLSKGNPFSGVNDSERQEIHYEKGGASRFFYQVKEDNKITHEPVVVARKPLEGTVADNVLEHGTGGINIDGCRIESAGEHKRPFQPTNNERGVYGKQTGFKPTNAEGRFPANVILNEEAGEILDEQSGHLKSGNMDSIAKGGQFNTYGVQQERRTTQIGDEGGASRFFYCAKPSRAERDGGLDNFEPQNVSDREDVSKAGANNPRNRGGIERKNIHPTVKPVDLMRYLCRLVTPPNGITLDPFMGSGTTGIAANLEGFSFIGIEMSEEYLEIARARIAHSGDYEITEDLTMKRIKQPSLLDFLGGSE